MARRTNKPRVVEICSVEGCGAVLPHNPRRIGKMCSPHARRQACTPERAEALRQTMLVKHQDPHFVASRAKNLSKARARMEAEGHPVTKVWREALLANRINPSVAGSEERRRAVAKGVNTRLAHIPLEYRGDYIRMSTRDRMSAADRSRMIQEQAAKDARIYAETGELPQRKRNGS